MIYALILSNKNEDIAASIIFHKIVNYTNIFFKENAGKLPEHEEDDHIIKLNKQNPFFKPLYNLFSSELKTLQEYLNNVLMKK